MNRIHVRQVFGDEALDILYRNNAYAFSASPPLRDSVEWREIVGAREGVSYFALFENDQAVSNAATTQMTQNIHGKMFTAGGVWAVATAPAARRKGYCRQVMRGLFESEYEAGRAVSLLYPFRGSFYERLGYATLPQPRKALFKPESLAPLLKQDLGGEVIVHSIAEGLDEYLSFLDDIQSRTHGFARFDFPEKAGIKKRNSLWFAKAVIHGKTAGIMLFDLRGEQIMHFKLRVFRFYTLNSRARYLLLQHIALHIDQADQIELMLPASEQPETWLADLRPELEPVFYAPMARIIRLDRLQGLPCGPAVFTANILDPDCPWNNGAWTFDGRNGSLEVHKAEQADFTIRIQAVAALIYGTHNPEDFDILQWGQIPEALHPDVQALFPRRLPHIHEMF